MEGINILTDRMEKIAAETGDFIFAEKSPGKADVIFVPGNGYPDMAEAAAGLYRKGLAPCIIPSGRYSITLGKFGGVLHNREKYSGDYETEWEFLRDVLIKNGVPEDAILREDRATYTYQNALFSKEAAEEKGLHIKKAILCVKNYHAGRALMYYQTVFPETEIMICPVSVDGITKENWRRSQEGIHEVCQEMQRIITQFSLFM